MSVCEYKPGLEGIPATQSSISYVDGQQGVLEYRGINIEELAEKSSFLETTYLLIWGELPSFAELEAFSHQIQTHRRIKYRIRDMMKCFPDSGHPMDALQASAAALGLFYSRRALDDPTYIREAV
ncbi:MAG TPA: citrate/2-methylcitrate synthase, partial [Candidatus Caenarcaniphilales bacterium]